MGEEYHMKLGDRAVLDIIYGDVQEIRGQTTHSPVSKLGNESSVPEFT